MAFFSFKTYLYRIFFAPVRNQPLIINPCAKFQLNWTKDKGTAILTWNDTKNSLMTSYLPPSDDINKMFMVFLLRDFFPEYHHAKFGCIWTTNKGETEGAQYTLSLYGSKIPQPE